MEKTERGHARVWTIYDAFVDHSMKIDIFSFLVIMWLRRNVDYMKCFEFLPSCGSESRRNSEFCM